MIHGNLEGIRQSTLDELEKLYDAQFARDEYLPDRLLNALVRFTMQLNRELLVYLCLLYTSAMSRGRSPQP